MIGLLLRFITSGFDLIARQFVNLMVLDGKETLDLFWGIFLPTAKGGGNAWTIMIAFGLFILYMIFLFQLFKSFFGPLTQSESPVKLTIKTMFFGILVSFSASICVFFFDVGTVPFDIMAGNDADINFQYEESLNAGTIIHDTSQGFFEDWDSAGGESEESSGENKKSWADKWKIPSLGDILKRFGQEIVYSIFTSLFSFIIVFSIAANYMKLVIEVAERYIILGVLSLFSPLCIATGASDATNNIFKSWIRVMISQCILMCLSVFFLKVFTSSIARIDDLSLIGTGHGGLTGIDGGKGYTPFVGLVLLLAWLRTGQRVDSHMSTLGLSAIQAGNGLFLDMLAGKRVMQSAAGGAKSAVGFGLGMKAAGGNLAGFMGSEYGQKKFGAVGKAAEMYNKKKAGKGNAKNSVASAAVDKAMLGGARGAAAMEGVKNKFGDTKIGGQGNKTLNDLQAEGSEMLGATMTENGAVADMIDKDGNRYQLSFGEGKDGQTMGNATFDTSQVGWEDGAAYKAVSGKEAMENKNAEELDSSINGPGGEETPEGNLVRDPETGEILGVSTDGDAQTMEDGLYGFNEDGDAVALATDEDGNALRDEDGNYIGMDGSAIPESAIEAGGGVHETGGTFAQGNEDNNSATNIGQAMKGDSIDPDKVKQDGKGNNFVVGQGGQKAAVQKEGKVDGLAQSGIQGGKALNEKGKMADISSALGADGKIDPSKVKNDKDGFGNYVTAKDGSRVSVGKGADGGFTPNGFEKMMAANNMAAGFDGNYHSVAGSMNGGKLDKSKIQTDKNGNSFITADDGAKIPVNSQGEIADISGGIGGGMAMGADGNLHDISDSLDANGNIDQAAIQTNADGSSYITSADGTQIGVNSATGEVLAGSSGYTAGAGFSATALGEDGQAHDITGAIDQTTGEISQAAIFTGEDGGQYIQAADGTNIAVGEDGSVAGLSVSDSIQTAAMGSDGALHDITGSIDANTGAIDPSAIQQDSEGSFVTSSDGVRVPVDANGAAEGMTTNAGSHAAVVDSNGQVQDLSSHTKSQGGLGLSVMSLNFGVPGGSGSSNTAYTSTSGSTVGATQGYTPTYGQGIVRAPSVGSTVAGVDGNPVDASSVINPRTGTVLPSSVSGSASSGYYATTASGERFPVDNHGSGVFTPQQSFRSYGGGAGEVIGGSGGSTVGRGIRVNGAGDYLTKNFIPNDNLESGFQPMTGTGGGTHVYSPDPSGSGGSYKALSSIGGMDASGNPIRYNKMGQPDSNGTFVRTASSTSSTGYDLSPATFDSGPGGSSSVKTFSPISSGGEGGGAYVQDPSKTGESKFRPIHSSGYTESGGIQRFDAQGNPSDTGAYARVDNGSGGYDLIKPGASSNGSFKTFSAETYFGGSKVQLDKNGGIILQNGAESSFTVGESGVGKLQLTKDGPQFSVVPAQALGSTANNFPVYEMHDGQKMCIVPDTNIAFNGNTQDLADTLRGTSLGDMFSKKIRQETNNFTSYGSKAEKGGAASYVKEGNQYRLATKNELADKSIPKYAQKARSGGYIRSRFASNGKQTVTNSYNTIPGNDIKSARNMENGKVAIVSNNVIEKDPATGKSVSEGVVLIPASGNMRHTLNDLYTGGKNVGQITKGGEKYFVVKAKFDDEGQLLTKLNMFDNPPPGGAFGSKKAGRMGRATF